VVAFGLVINKEAFNSLLEELYIVESFEHPGKPARFREMTKKQQELYRALKVGV
jgi:hypothetical protein